MLVDVGDRRCQRSIVDLCHGSSRGWSAQMTDVKLDDLLGEIQADIDEELASMPDVVEKEPDSFDVEKLPLGKREWHKLDDLVAVAVDLKGSTKLGTGKHAASTASIYEASTDNAVRVFHDFEADFIQIQGDGVIALFWGDGRYERAMCAGITVKTFSKYLETKLREKWGNAPETGYKVGAASGRVLVKSIGTPRNPAEQEPIWSGKPVNYAVKAAQTAQLGEFIVSGDVWASIEDNDYLTSSCTHGNSPAPLWSNVTIDKVSDDDDARFGRVLSADWCASCGAGFCDAILSGETYREDAAEARAESKRVARQSNLALVIERKRNLTAFRRSGLANW